jgi:hypothetical protein
MNRPTESPRFESRWPVAVAILAVIFLLAILPERIQLFPTWVPTSSGSLCSCRWARSG